MFSCCFKAVYSKHHSHSSLHEAETCSLGGHTLDKSENEPVRNALESLQYVVAPSIPKCTRDERVVV